MARATSCASRRVRWRAAQLLAAPHWTRAFWLLWSIIVRCSAFLGLALNNRTDSAFSCAGTSLSSFGDVFHVVGSLVRLEPGCDLARMYYLVQYLGDRSYRDIRRVQVPPLPAQPGPRAPYTKRPSEHLYRDLDKKQLTFPPPSCAGAQSWVNTYIYDVEGAERRRRSLHDPGFRLTYTSTI